MERKGRVRSLKDGFEQSWKAVLNIYASNSVLIEVKECFGLITMDGVYTGSGERGRCWRGKLNRIDNGWLHG